MNNLEKLKVAIETEEEIKRNPEYKKFTQLLNECSKVKSSFAKEQKDILKPFVKYTTSGILFLKVMLIRYFKNMVLNW